MHSDCALIVDFLEEVLQEEIVDETDVFVDNTQLARAAALGVHGHAPDAEGTPPPPLQKSSQSSIASSSTTTRRRRAYPRVNSKKYDTTAVLKALCADGGKHAGKGGGSVWA